MTLSNELNAGIEAATAAIAEGVSDAMADLINLSNAEASANAGPKAKGRKSKAKPKTAAEVKEDAAKPAAPHAIDGFAVNDGVDVESFKESEKAAISAIDAINRKDADLLDSYLALGSFNSAASKVFKSTKDLGKYIAKHVPASQDLDAALRSNCKWLWEALNDPEHDAYGSLLVKLGLAKEGDNRDPVELLKSYKSANPTVIRREYSNILKAEDAHRKAEELGVSPEEVGKIAKEKAKEDQEAELAICAENIIAAISGTNLSKNDIAHSVAELVKTLRTRKGDDFYSACNVFKVKKAPKVEHKPAADVAE